MILTALNSPQNDILMSAAMIALFVVAALTVLILFALIFLSREKSSREKEDPAAECLQREETELYYQPTPAPVYWMFEEPKPLLPALPSREEESFAAGAVRYDKSFTAKLIQADDDTKDRYTRLKNFLLGFSKVKAKISWKHETYRFGKEIVLTLLFRGKTLCALFQIPTEQFRDSKYKMEAVDETAQRSLYRLKSELRLKYVKEIFTIMMERRKAKPCERESVDYYLPYEGVVELIEKGFIRRKITKKSAEDFLRAQKENVALALSC